MMNIGLDIPTFIRDNSFYDLSEAIASKVEPLLYESLLPLKQQPPP